MGDDFFGTGVGDEGDDEEDDEEEEIEEGFKTPEGDGGGGGESHRRSQSSSAVLSIGSATSRLKAGWKAVKKSGVKGTVSAVKTTASATRQLSGMSKDYWKAGGGSGGGGVSGGGGARAGLPMTPAERAAWEERQGVLCEEWVGSILPAWKKRRRGARVRDLVFRGVPVGVRGRVWKVALGNELNITPELFGVLKERAMHGRMEFMRTRETVERADGDVGGFGGKAEAALLEQERCSHKAIMLDLPRTFPELAFFHADGSVYEGALRDILEAFIYLRPDIGYSQGMSFLAAVLLLYVEEPAEAFACFVNMLLHKSCFLHFFSMKMPEVRIYLLMHDRFMREEMPALHAHFKQHGVEADLYMINWVMSLYCGALPLDLVSRIWDVYVLDGDVAIFRAALGILKLLMPRLLTMNFEEIAYQLSHLPADIEADALMHAIRGVRTVTRSKFKDTFRLCEQHSMKVSLNLERGTERAGTAAAGEETRPARAHPSRSAPEIAITPLSSSAGDDRSPPLSSGSSGDENALRGVVSSMRASTGSTRFEL